MEELKKCPFCGGGAEVENGTDGASIKCSKCGVATEYYKDTPPYFALGGRGDSRDFRMVEGASFGIKEAVKTWNRRCCE